MGNKHPNTGWGPQDSGDQESPDSKVSGGTSEVRDDGTVHHTDFNDSGRASWDEHPDGTISGQHNTDVPGRN